MPDVDNHDDEGCKYDDGVAISFHKKITCLEELKCYELAKKMLTALIMQNRAYAK